MHQSLSASFFSRASELTERTAIRFKEGRGPYRDMTWTDLARMIKEMAAGLASMGFEPGQRAAIMSQTSHLWVAADLAIMANAGVSVPIYPTSSTSDIEFILKNSEARFVFVQNENLMSKVIADRERLPNLQRIVLLSAPSGGKSLTELNIADGLVIGLEELQEAGRALFQEKPSVIDERMSASRAEDLATIIYTSGTTGTPKGVKLTYANIFGVLNELPSVLPIDSNDIYLSFLPLSHVFERVCGEFYWISSGSICAFAEGIEYVAKNMAEIEPTYIIVVPRVLDRIYAKVKGGIQGASGRARELIEWAIGVGKEMYRHQVEGKQPRVGLKAKHWLAERLVFRKMRTRIGKRLRMVVSGGAPACQDVIEFFNAIGISTLEGYGLTETTAPAAVNRIGKNKPGTVGPPLPSVRVKIAEDGEILLKGPGVFSGYFRADELTREAFDEEGWFRTGDIGVVDSDNYIKITDRKKDLIINSAGKNIAPQRIEAILKTIPLVTQAIVFGDKRKHLVAILTLDETSTTELGREKGWTFNDYEELAKLPELHRCLRQEINKCSEELADYERVRRFAILPHEFSIESGELTATLKVKRNVVAEKYRDLVESLYASGSGAEEGDEGEGVPPPVGTRQTSSAR